MTKLRKAKHMLIETGSSTVYSVDTNGAHHSQYDDVLNPKPKSVNKQIEETRRLNSAPETKEFYRHQ